MTVYGLCVRVYKYLQHATHNTRGTLCAGDSSLSSQLDLAHAQVSLTAHPISALGIAQP